MFVEWCILFHCIIMNICVLRAHIELQKCTKSALTQKLVKCPTENQQQTVSGKFNQLCPKLVKFPTENLQPTLFTPQPFFNLKEWLGWQGATKASKLVPGSLLPCSNSMWISTRGSLFDSSSVNEVRFAILYRQSSNTSRIL